MLTWGGGLQGSLLAVRDLLRTPHAPRNCTVAQWLGAGTTKFRPLTIRTSWQSFWPHQDLEFTQPLTEVSTGNIKKIMFLGSKVWPVHGADNLTAIYEPIV
jgi:hypothetical protein